MNNIYRFYFLVLMAALMALPIHARASEDELQHPVILDRGTVKEILKSDMIMLDNEKRYRLENILIPPYEDLPAIDELNHALLNKAVTIYSYHDDKTKHGLPLVHVITSKNIWVQEDLVSKGLAWAFCSGVDTSQQMMHALKVMEDTARMRQLGFWKNPIYAIKTPQEVKKYMNSYQIVEGRILSVNVKSYSGSTFLNFGKNWKTDFEVRVRGSNGFLGLVKDPGYHKKIKKPVAKKQDFRPPVKSNDPAAKEEDDFKDDFKDEAEAAFDPRDWENRVVRVRGWVHGTSAPTIDVTEKEQIDFMDADEQ